jgi:hypothetical protein
MKNYEKFNEDYGFDCTSEEEMIDAFWEVSEFIGYKQATDYLLERYNDIGVAFIKYYENFGIVAGVEATAAFINEQELYDEYVNNWDYDEDDEDDEY